MNLVFAASEAAPYIKTGGLGDVAEALPASLAKNKENEISLFLPYYSRIKNNPNVKPVFLKNFSVNLAWRTVYVGLFKCSTKRKNLNVYLIDNEYYFSRNGIYGEYDDGERFAYFSKAILESLSELDIVPDIIHCNDWQTALIPVFLHAFYGEKLGGTKTVFTIHNIEYQGKAEPYFLADVLGLPREYENTMTFNGCVNFMKGAILKADAVTTVSKTYAEEIKYPYYSHGLSDIINEHSFKLSGIVNGINVKINNPKTDAALFRNYGISDFQIGKSENKAELQKLLGLEIRQDVPMIAMVTRLVSHKGLDLLASRIDELMNFDIQLVIIGTGDKKYESVFRSCAENHKNKFSMNLCFDPSLAQKIYAASDIYLMPSKSEPCGLSQLIAMRYGSVPVVNCTGGLKDTVIPFNTETGEGNGFNFQSFNADDMLGAIRRCLEIYGGDKVKWNKLVKNDMKYDSSWDKPADEYSELYKNITNK